MTSSMLRRQLKNLVQNYSEAEVKVREATSNDPWGPSSSQMADISDLTYNVVACNEIMTMLWKRLKDDKNWRHIHKSLTLLEYLLKTGDDRVLLKMKDNIYIVKALTEYRFVEKDGKDQGVNVREKAKVVLVLMEDDEKLKEEREFAVKTREKTSKSAAASSADNVKDPNYKPCYVPGTTGLPSLDNIPSVADLTASFAARKEERLKQEAEKKEAERRAKMSEEELKWEDANKGSDVKIDAWGGEKEEEVKTDPWGAPKEPKEAVDPWGTPSRPDTTETAASSDPWGAPTSTDKDPFAAEQTNDDPFVAPKNGEDPFAAPKNGEDPFVAPKNGEDPFSASKDDPFNTPKDSSDPFSAPKDTQDPFAAQKDKPDPFSSSNNDPFNAPKDDPFKAPKDDPFITPKADPFSTPKEDPFSAPKEDPFITPKDDPFNAPKDDPFSSPKDDPFSAPALTPPKEDPFAEPSSGKEDPFTAPTTPPKEDPFSAPTKPAQDPFAAPTTPPKEDPFSTPSLLAKDDPFAAPTSPPQEDPFSTRSKPTKEDPFAAPTTPPKPDPFTAPSSPPKVDATDPFDAPLVSSPQSSTDAWGPPATSPPATGSDPWGTTASASSTISNSDPFGDASKADNDPWGPPASAPASTDDAWGAPAPPLDSSPSSDPFGDGASKSNDPWGASSNTSGNGTGTHLKQEDMMYRKTASFLGSAGASLVDLDDLFSSDPKPRQRPLIDTQTQAIGTFKAAGMTSSPMLKSGAFAETSPSYSNPFISTIASPHGAPTPISGANNPSASLNTLGMSNSSTSMIHASQMGPETGMLNPIYIHESPQLGHNMNSPVGGVGMVQFGYPGSLLMGTGIIHSGVFQGNHPSGDGQFRSSVPQAGAEVVSGSGSDEIVNKNNPFLF
ncbi:unnamed protein product [Oreochromis niloticus]|nr:unnamed protein product [Mustela putorius furo]